MPYSIFFIKPAHCVTYELYKALFPRTHTSLPLPASDVILMNGRFFSISKFMEGENLEYILEKSEKNPEYCKKYSFDLESFQRLALFCLLTNPEDCRLQNCLVKKMPNSDKHQFILIDNERNFCREIVKNAKGEIITRVHCSLFCFRELLKKKIDHHLLRRNIMKAIYDWEKKCNAHSEYLLRLSAFAQNHENQTELDIFKNRSPIKSLNKKLYKIKIFFDKQGNYFNQARISLVDIFKEIMPDLAHIYLDPKDTLPENSYEFQLTLKRISSIDAGRSGSKAPPSSYVPIEKWKMKSGKKLQRAENGSFLGEISEATSRRKTIFAEGYYRRNGTYVHGYYRS